MAAWWGSYLWAGRLIEYEAASETFRQYASGSAEGRPSTSNLSGHPPNTNKGQLVSRDAPAVLKQTNLATQQFFVDFRHENEEMVPPVGFEPTTRCLEAPKSETLYFGAFQARSPGSTPGRSP